MKVPEGEKWSPTDQIGIALSGGGTRAVGFHLGVFEYLHRLELLSKVSMLSSASGGSFIAAKFALFLAEFLQEKTTTPGNDTSSEHFFDEFFNLFFKDFYCHLRDIRFLEFVAEALGRARKADDDYAIPSKRYTLVSAVADLYAETFLKSAKTNKPYLYRNLTDTPPNYPLKHVILNATDYHNCVAFRFTSDPESDVGNVYLYDGYCKPKERHYKAIKDDCKNLRVADIVAASSCLPPLFEPIGFPDDFAWPGGIIPENVGKLCSYPQQQGIRKPRPVPLMDGGLYDNQAIESLVLADRDLDLKEMGYLFLAQQWEHNAFCNEQKDTGHRSQLGMFIVSDADRKDKKHNKFEYNDKRNNREFGNFDKGISVGLILLLAVSILVGTEIFLLLAMARMYSDISAACNGGVGVDWQRCVAFFIHIILFVLLSGGCTVFVIYSAQMWQKLKTVPQVGSGILKTIFRLRLNWLIDALGFRIFSVKETIFDVLLKRTRDLEYSVLYSDSHYFNKRVPTMLHQLLPEEDTTTLPGAEDGWNEVGNHFQPSEKLALFIQRANDVDTRFWFLKNKPWEQQCLVASGQATICFTLAQFIVRQYGGKSHLYPPDILILWEKLREDWQKLKKDPYSLLKDRFERAHMDDCICVEPPLYKLRGQEETA